MQKFYSAFKENAYLLVIALLIFIPLYPKFPLLNVKGTYVAIRLEDVLIGLVVLIWGFLNLTNFKKLLSRTVYQSMLLFWIIGAISLLSAVFLTKTVNFNLGFFHYLRRVEEMSLFVVAATSFSSIKQIKLTLKVMLPVTLAIIFYGFGQQWLHFPVVSTTNKEFSKGIIVFLTSSARVNSTFAGHYDLAAYMSLALVFISSFFIYSKKIWEKTIIGISGILSFTLLGMTAARISFAAALAGIALSFLLNGKKLLIGILILLSVLSVAAIPDLRHRFVATITVNLLNGGGPKLEIPTTNQVNTPRAPVKLSESSKAAYLASSLNESTLSAATSSKIANDIAPGEPINATELGVYRSFGIRSSVEWPRAIRALVRNPLLGTGYSSITLATDNDILRSFGEVGILGTLSLALVFYILLKKSWRFIRFESEEREKFARYFVVAGFSSIIAIILTSTFIDVLEASKIGESFWIIMGISYALISNFEDAK